MYGCHNITIILIKAVKSPCIAWVSIQDIHSYYLVISSQRLNFMIKSYAISTGDTRSWYSYWLVINRPQLYTKHYIAKSYLHWQFSSIWKLHMSYLQTFVSVLFYTSQTNFDDLIKRKLWATKIFLLLYLIFNIILVTVGW